MRESLKNFLRSLSILGSPVSEAPSGSTVTRVTVSLAALACYLTALEVYIPDCRELEDPVFYTKAAMFKRLPDSVPQIAICK